MACTAIAVSDWPKRAPWGTPPKFRVRHGVASLQGLWRSLPSLACCAHSVLLRSCIIDFLMVLLSHAVEETIASRAGRKDSEMSCMTRWFLANHRFSDRCPRKTEHGSGLLCVRHMTSFPTSTRLSTPALHHHHHHYERTQVQA